MKLYEANQFWLQTGKPLKFRAGLYRGIGSKEW
jgi:hypothetical protein